MKAEHWDLLSAWHNAWLDASAEDRPRLRAQWIAAQPDLAAHLDRLLAMTPGLDGFLDVPAFVQESAHLADEPEVPPGTMVGAYRIAERLGRGGSGDVYRARDVRLDRDAAVKILTVTDPADPQRVDRFLGEARVTAALDHPNIVRLYDVGMFEGRPFLVTELLVGETLRARIAHGPVAEADCRRIGADIAAGLVAAHGRGLVHRDLKPENLFITRACTKILDFGIAKLSPEWGVRASLATVTGVVLGTAGYLAPEQIRGDAIDTRTDLFALGSILYEMLTGARAFAREHTVDTLHAIVHEAPADLRRTTDVSADFAAIVMRLLEKQPDARFQSAADLEWALGQPYTRPALARPERPRRPRWPLWSAAAAVAVGALAVWTLRARAHEPALRPVEGMKRFTWALPQDLDLDSAPAVSPDGESVAFTGVDRSSGTRLFLRSLSALDVVPMAGTEGAAQPFWSPDSRWIGFFADGKLKKVTPGGVPIILCDAPDARGGAWSADHTIVFAPRQIENGLSRVPADGGEAVAATILDLDRAENAHRWPSFLPDGVHFLYFVRSSNDERRGVYIGSLDRPAAPPGDPLFRSESDAVYAPLFGADGGMLFYEAHGILEARRFDPARRVLVGDPLTTGLSLAGNSLYHPAMLGTSSSVLAIVRSGLPTGVRLTSVGRDGEAARVWEEREAQNWPRLSPDGRWLARQRLDATRGNPDIWVEDLERGTRLRVTTAPDDDVLPVWSPDGRRLAYLSGRRNHRALHIASADGTGVLQVLPCPGTYCEPTDWTPDGRALILNVQAGHGTHVWTASTDTAGSAQPLLPDSFVARDARVSSDGQWLAYVSEESGRPEVSVRSVQGAPRRFVVSSGGGDQPVWRRDGAELFYVDPQGGLLALPVRRSADRLAFGPPRRLGVPAIANGHGGTQYDVSPDGARIYFLDGGERHSPREMDFVLGIRALFR